MVGRLHGSDGSSRRPTPRTRAPAGSPPPFCCSPAWPPWPGCSRGPRPRRSWGSRSWPAPASSSRTACADPPRRAGARRGSAGRSRSPWAWSSCRPVIWPAGPSSSCSPAGSLSMPSGTSWVGAVPPGLHSAPASCPRSATGSWRSCCSWSAALPSGGCSRLPAASASRARRGTSRRRPPTRMRTPGTRSRRTWTWRIAPAWPTWPGAWRRRSRDAPESTRAGSSHSPSRSSGSTWDAWASTDPRSGSCRPSWRSSETSPSPC